MYLSIANKRAQNECMLLFVRPNEHTQTHSSATAKTTHFHTVSSSNAIISCCIFIPLLLGLVGAVLSFRPVRFRFVHCAIFALAFFVCVVYLLYVVYTTGERRLTEITITAENTTFSITFFSFIFDVSFQVADHLAVTLTLWQKLHTVISSIQVLVFILSPNINGKNRIISQYFFDLTFFFSHVPFFFAFHQILTSFRWKWLLQLDMWIQTHFYGAHTLMHYTHTIRSSGRA